MLFPSKKVLSHQISNAIKQKWGKECMVILDEVVENDTVSNNDQLIGCHSIQNTNAILMNRMKERLEALEELNDHLCYYLSFLIENLPELINKTILSESKFNCIIGNGDRSSAFNDKLKESNGLFPFPTRRENDVIELLEKGFCAKEIATRLYISESTVITHKKNLKKKFNVKNTAELISKLRSKT